MRVYIHPEEEPMKNVSDAVSQLDMGIPD